MQKRAADSMIDLADSGVSQPAMTPKISMVKRLLLAGAVGTLFAVSFPPIGLYFLLPLCVALLLCLLEGASGRQAFYLGMVCGTVWFCGDLFWIARLFGNAVLSLCVILALFPAIFALSYVWFRARLPRFPLWLLVPLLWTGIEYYRSELFVLKFGWMGLGYGVVNAPLLALFASWFGCYGVTFVIVLTGTLLAGEVLDPGSGSGSRPDGLPASHIRTSNIRTRLIRGVVLIGCWLLLCLLPLAAPRPLDPLHVRLVQANSEDEESFYRLSRRSPGQPVDIIVWPEYSFVTDPMRTPKLWPKIRRVAQENHTYLLFGAKDQFDPAEEASFRNTAFLLDLDGVLIGRHVKNHPVHFIRDGVPGTKAQAIATSFGRLGVAICFDMDYPDVARRLAEDGACLFLVPNDDPPEWGPIQRMQHRLLFQMRAAECGRWLARADVAGGTSTVAPNGQEFARIGTTQPAALDVVVGRQSHKTLFVLGGWRFGPLCMLITILLWGWGLISHMLARR